MKNLYLKAILSLIKSIVWTSFIPENNEREKLQNIDSTKNERVTRLVTFFTIFISIEVLLIPFRKITQLIKSKNSSFLNSFLIFRFLLPKNRQEEFMGDFYEIRKELKVHGYSTLSITRHLFQHTASIVLGSLLIQLRNFYRPQRKISDD